NRHYGPEDKLPLMQETLNRTYRPFGDSGEYPLPRISFSALEKSEFPDENGDILPSRTLGEIRFPGPEIVLNEELKNGDLETLFSVTVHECLHGLVTGFHRGCYGVKKDFL